MKNIMNIAFTVTDSYIDYMGTTILSLVKTQHIDTQLNIFVLSSDISSYSERKLKILENRYSNLKINVIKVNSADFEGLPLNREHINRLEVYFRMAFATLLPQNIDKVLYLDSDVLVKNDLLKLWNEEINDYYMAGVSEPPSEGAFNYRRGIGMNNPEYYFNSGVLLMNLKKIREDNIQEKLFICGEKIKDKILLQDQDIINVALEGKIKPVDVIYNYGYMEREKNLRDNNEIVIEHFSLEKPWNTHIDVIEYNRLGVDEYMENYYNYIEEVEPLVSIILNINNSDKDIDKTISSILSQKYKNFECIILNYSDDNNKLYKYLTNKKIKIYNLENNNTLTNCLSKINGKYVTFVEADDWLDNRYIDTILTNFEDNNVDIIISNVVYFEKSSSLFKYYNNFNINRIVSGTEIIKYANTVPEITNYFTSMNGKFFKKEYLLDLFNICGDFDERLFSRLFIISTTKVLNIESKLYVYTEKDNDFLNNIYISKYFEDLNKYKFLLNINYNIVDNNFYKLELQKLKIYLREQNNVSLENKVTSKLQKIQFIEQIERGK